MIPTLQIQEALAIHIRGTELVEKVVTHTDADLGKAIEAMRDAPESLVVIVPGSDRFLTEVESGTNDPLFSEVRNGFELLICGRNLDMRESGDPATLTLKDHVVAALLWDDLSVPGLLCLPESCEPMAIQFDGGRGREAWKLTVELRQIITG